MDEVLPWDHISSGVKKKFLTEELRRSREEKLTPDCRTNCLECGVCDHQAIDPVLAKKQPLSLTQKISGKLALDNQMKMVWKYRITFTKKGRARFLSHLELSKVFTRAFRRARLPLVYSKGYHPMPEISFFNALPVGTESMHETLDLELKEKIDPLILLERINEELPAGMEVSLIERLGLNEKGAKLVESHFRITLNGSPINHNAMNRFIKSDYFPIVRKGKKGDFTINARDLVNSMQFISPNVIEMSMRHTEGPSLRPEEIIRNVFSFSDEEVRSMSIVKTSQKLESKG